MAERAHWISVQAAALAGVVVGWCVWPGAGIYFLLGCYLLVLAGAQAASYFRARLLPPAARWQKVVGVVLLLCIALFTWLRTGVPLVESEGWSALTTQLADRWTLDAQPAVFPLQIHASHPQRFFVYDADASDVGIKIGERTLESQALGHGTWYFDYDPRRDGMTFERCGPATIEVMVDGTAVPRELTAIVPQPHPRWPAANATLGLGACTSEETDEVFCVDRKGNLIRLATGDGPAGCVVLSDATVAVCHRYLDEVWFLAAQSGEVVARVTTSKWQNRLELSPDGKWLAIAIQGPRPAIGWIETETRRFAGVMPLEFRPEWLAFGADTATVVASCTHDQTLRLLRGTSPGDPDEWREAAEPIRLGRPARSMCRGADGRMVFFTASGWNPTGGHFVGGNHYVEHLILGLDVEEWRVTQRHDTEGRGNVQSAPGASDLGLDPIGLAPVDRETLMVTYSGSNQVGPFRLAGGNPARARSLAQVGVRVPQGLADMGEGIWVLADVAGGALAVYDVKENACNIVALGMDDVELAERDPLAWEQRLGETVFFEGTQTGISCNSCHMNADSDYALHDISDLTPTLSVRGIGGTSPYLRVPSYGSLVELHEKLADGLFGGYQDAVSYDRAKMLDAFVMSLPRPVNPRWSESSPERMREGMDALAAGGCQQCHVPPAFTNLAQHSEEWLFPQREHSYGRLLDTPSLLQVGTKSRWLVDGRAATVGAVLDDHNESNRHGDTASLNADERQAVVELLESL